MKVEIPDAYVGWAAAIFAAITGWLLNLQRQLLARPTRKEQAMLAKEVATDLSKRFDKIEMILDKQNQTLEKQNENTVQHRQWMGETVAGIRTQIAVIRTRMGDDPLEESGMFKRIGK